MVALTTISPCYWSGIGSGSRTNIVRAEEEEQQQQKEYLTLLRTERRGRI